MKSKANSRVVLCLWLLLSCLPGFNLANAQSPLLVQAEYFYDTDPGLGNGSSISFMQDSLIDVNFELDVSGLSPGFHKTYFRTKDENNVWSLTNVMNIYVEEDQQNPVFQPLPDIVQVEYFLDTDPGEGNGISIPFTSDSIIDVNFEIGLTSVSPGFHKAYFRTKDENNIWSLTNVMNIYVADSVQVPPPYPKLTGMEYFFDADPGFGQGYPVEVIPDSLIDLVFAPDLTYLTQLGQHRLYARVKDENNIWSLVYNQLLIVDLIANFEANTTNILQNESVQFTNLSMGNVTGWQWDFENDGIIDSYEQNPEWFYTEPGEYSVLLTVSAGVSQNTYIKHNYIKVIPVQYLEIPAGWSGISSYINPSNPDIEAVMDSISGELIIVKDIGDNIYWPEGGVNTLENWSSAKGYWIKMNDAASLKLSGTRSLGNTLQLTEGWNLIPVWSQCEVPVTNLFNIPQTVVVKSAAGYQLYWPEKNINTLGNLEPGKAYLVKLSGSATIVFPECE